MNAGTITALTASIVAVLGAIAGVITAFRGKLTANATQQTLTAHLASHEGGTTNDKPDLPTP